MSSDLFFYESEIELSEYSISGPSGRMPESLILALEDKKNDSRKRGRDWANGGGPFCGRREFTRIYDAIVPG
jgi:hypothetical protein